MAATLNISKRPCKLGNSMSTNTEKHGDEDVGAIDLQLDGIVLNAGELDALLGNEAHKSIYRYPLAGTGDKTAPLPEVRFAHLKPLAFRDHFEGARVELTLGIEEYELELHQCKVRSIKLTPETGGLTTMSCSIRSTPDGEAVATLYAYLNGEASVAIYDAKQAEKAKNKQQGLPLGEQQDGSDEHPDPDAQNGADGDQAPPRTH